MSTDPWSNEWLSNKEARAIRAEEAERRVYTDAVRNRTIERATRADEIDTYVTEMVTEAENFGISLLIWVAVVLFAIAAVGVIVHAIGAVMGLTVLSLAALITYLIKEKL